MSYKYLFGPVPSRRLGASLGVDFLPYKTCTMNCVYCEVKETTNLTICRQEFFPVNEVISELDDFLNVNPNLDYITFSGSGEPTLYSKIGEIIGFLKTNYPQYKIALITNSSLLYDINVRKEISQIDVILPSLDAVSDEIFRKINNPHPKIDIQQIIDGLNVFRKESKSKMWLEIFIVPGLNDNTDELELLKQVVKKIYPDILQLNTLDRPGQKHWVKPASIEQLNKISSFFSSALPVVEIVSSTQFMISRKNQYQDLSGHEKILAIIKRRPCTIEDICSMLNIKDIEARRYLRYLIEKNLIEVVSQQRGDFYKLK